MAKRLDILPFAVKLYYTQRYVCRCILYMCSHNDKLLYNVRVWCPRVTFEDEIRDVGTYTLKV